MHAGLRYVLYAFLCDLQNPHKVIARPGGYFMAPEERGTHRGCLQCPVLQWTVMREDGTICIYYASSDTRMHVATSTEDRMLDYVLNTPEDAGRSAASVEQRMQLIDKNLAFINTQQS